jgi:hypothetical protein
VRRGETHYLYAYVSHSHGADDGAEWASIRCWTRAWTSDGDLRCGGSGCYRCGLSDACTAHLVSFLLVRRFPVANMEGGTLWIVVSLFMSYVLNFRESPERELRGDGVLRSSLLLGHAHRRQRHITLLALQFYYEFYYEVGSWLTKRLPTIHRQFIARGYDVYLLATK